MKRIKLWTVQLAKWRLVRELGIHLLDITAKSGNPAFAPNYGDLRARKYGGMEWEEYERRYRLHMRETQRDQPDEWLKLTELPENVALACYCPAGAKCHRFLFREILTEYLGRHNVEAVDGHEITGYIHNNVSELQEHVPKAQPTVSSGSLPLAVPGNSAPASSAPGA
jgi:uncharacterized protein YeaO (DUF488 family)